MLGRPALKALAIESPGYYVRNELGAKRLQETENEKGLGSHCSLGSHLQRHEDLK